MPAVDLHSIDLLREDLLRIEPPFLLRKYEATEEDYESLAQEDLRCEYLDGVLIVHSPATLEHEERVGFLTILVGGFVSQRKLGRMYTSNAVMQFGGPSSKRFCADVSVLKHDSAKRVRGGRVHGPMDLAIEVISESTRAYDLGDKRRAYREGRVPEIWLLDYARKQAWFDLLVAGAYVEESMTSGRFNSRVLPGLSLDVGWIWAEELPEPLACLKSLKPSPRRSRSKR